MDAVLTWKYFVLNRERFQDLKELAEELDTYRNRELTDEEANRKEDVISQIDTQASEIAEKVIEYKDQDACKDGTIMEELVYRMDEAPELQKYTEPDEYYFKFLVYITPDDLLKQFKTIIDIFREIEKRNLLKEEFIGKWIYLNRAKEILSELKDMYEFAHKNEFGIIKIDKVEWLSEINEEETIEIETDMVDV